jgi:hypothetical protein
LPVLSLVEFLHEMPPASEGALLRVLQTWDGKREQDAVLALLPYLHPMSFQRLLRAVLQPLVLIMRACRVGVRVVGLH